MKFCPLCKRQVWYVKLRYEDVCDECGCVLDDFHIEGSRRRYISPDVMEKQNEHVLKIDAFINKVKKYNPSLKCVHPIKLLYSELLDAQTAKKMSPSIPLIPMILDLVGLEKYKREYTPLSNASKEKARITACKNILKSAGYHPKDGWENHIALKSREFWDDHLGCKVIQFADSH